MNFIYDTKPEDRFIAFFGDGSGADLFIRVDGGDIYNSHGEIVSDDWLMDAGYCQWMPLLENIKLWFEITEEPHP